MIIGANMIKERCNNTYNNNNTYNENNKVLSLDNMRDMSIDEIVKLYRDGYRLDGTKNNVSTESTDIISTNMAPSNISPSNIISMSFGSQCSGDPTVATNLMGPLLGMYSVVQKGMVWAQKFNANYLCLDTVGFNMLKHNNVDFFIEIRKDYGGLPQGIPLQDDTGLVYRTSAISYMDLPTPSYDWRYFSISTLLPANGDYWICLVPTDFYDSPTYRTLAYDRFRLQETNDVPANPSSHYNGGVWTNSSTLAFVVYKLPTYTAPSNAQVFNSCWGSSLGASCGIPPERPAVTTGTQFTIKADLANNGATGKIRAVFKANGTIISDQNNPSLATFPGGGLWSPAVNYTMPGTDVTLVVDGYGWDGTSWILTNTMSAIISRSTPACSGISIDASNVIANVGDMITLTAYGITPTTQAYAVTFTDRSNTVLGTCTSSNGTCSIAWNTTGKTAGTYYVKASVAGQCTSTELAIGLSLPIQQWTLDVYVRDVNTLIGIYGASVTINAYGPPTGTQTLSTDTNGRAQFIITQGTIDVIISKTGYNTRTIVDSLYNNRTATYYLTPTTPNPGSLRFITVPSSAEVFFGTVSKGITNATTGILQIDNLSAGQVINYTVKKTGYNDSSGSTTVQSGAILDVPVSLAPVTPTTGSACIKSNPPGASIKIGTVLQVGKTTTMSGSGCTSYSTIYDLAPVLTNYELSLTGFQNKTGQFIPIAGTTIDVDVGSLTPSPTMGNLIMTSTPSGAMIYMDNSNVPTGYVTPASITSILQGSHPYKLVLVGYKDATGTFNITAGQTTTVPNVTLIRRVGTLKFFSTPVGATILIGGISKGVTTSAGLSVSNLPIGPTGFVAKLTNYEDYIGNTTVIEDATTNVSITLTPLTTGKGSLHIETTPPGAEVFIDGIDKNIVTPTTISNIDEGGHVYELIKSGYYSIYEGFTILPGQTTTIIRNLQLVAGKGSLYVETTPPGAEVFIDGVDKNVVTPTTIPDLNEGTHPYELQKSGYDSVFGVFSILEGQTTSITKTLQQSTTGKGSLHIETTPPGAEVFIDGVDKNVVTPTDMPNLDVGNYAYELRKSGYKNVSGAFAITSGQTTTIAKTLESTTAGGGGGDSGMLLGLVGVVAIGAMMMSSGSVPTKKL